MASQLKGRIVVVTGASRGIGRRIARGLARRGAHLVLVARQAEALAEVAEEVRGMGVQAWVVAVDLTRAEDRARLVAEAEAAGPVYAVVHNAGLEITVGFEAQRPDEVQRQVDLNLMAPMLLTQDFLPGMRARGAGVVVMISSLSGKGATPYNAVYAATKHGLNGFTSSLRMELEGTGVHVGVVCPGFVAEAGMWADVGLKAPGILREVTPEQVVDGVLKVMGGAPEVLVSSGPLRPLLALVQLFPRLEGVFYRATGVLRALQDRARVTQERRDGPPSA